MKQILFLIFIFFLSCNKNSSVIVDISLDCMDEIACNYTADATSNDGCVYSLDEMIVGTISDGCELPENTLYLNEENIVFYNSNNDIGGIQFSLYGGTILDAQGGDIQESSFNINFDDGETVLIYSLTGTTLPAGCGNLIELTIEGVPIGLSSIIISDTVGFEIDFMYYGGCDCDGNMLDCNGECNGGATEDQFDSCCEVVDKDCFGECNGDATEDSCGECSGGNSEHIADSDIDCNGVCFGMAGVSECPGVGCQDYPYYNYHCDDIAVLQQIINGNETFSGLEFYQLGNMQYWNEDEDGWRISVLDLSVHQLTAIPDQISDLEFLEILYLQNNDLVTLPNSIGALGNLEKLYLQYNDLSTLPATIGNMGSLTHLDLTENEIVSLPDEITSLSTLSYLSLYRNNLSYLPELIGNLISLEHLDLGQNQLASIPESIGDLINLEYLFINNNTLFLSSLPDAISDLESLIELKMNDNMITSLPLNIGTLSNLEILNCTSNELSTLPETLCDLPDDCDILLNNNNLCDETLLLFSECIYQDSNQNQGDCGE